jgi:hypothetical protein
MSILQNARDIAELVKKYNDQDLYQKIVGLREEIIEIREENIALKEEVRRLKDAQTISAKLVRKGNRYFLADDEKEEKPFCLACWDYDRKLVGLLESSDRWGSYIHCNICKARGK